MPLPLLSKLTSKLPWAEQTLLCPLSASGMMGPRPACPQLRYQRSLHKKVVAKSPFDPIPEVRAVAFAVTHNSFASM